MRNFLDARLLGQDANLTALGSGPYCSSIVSIVFKPSLHIRRHSLDTFTSN